MKSFILSLLLFLGVNICNAQCTGAPPEPVIKVKKVGTNYILYTTTSTTGLKCEWVQSFCGTHIPAMLVIGGFGDSIIVSESDATGRAYILGITCKASGLTSRSCWICPAKPKDKSTVPSSVRKCPGDSITITASVYMIDNCKQLQWEDSIKGIIPGATSKTLQIIAPASPNAYRLITTWPDDSLTYSDWVSYLPYYCPSYSPFTRPSSGTKGDEPLGTMISEGGSLALLYNIYPNPSDGNINITQKLADVKPIEIVVYNLQGKVVLKASKQFIGNSLSLHLDDIPDGLYLLQVTDNNGQSSRLRIAIQK